MDIGAFAANPTPFNGAMAIAGVLPGGGEMGKFVKEIYISRSKYGEAAAHIEEAIKAGKPDILTIDRGGTANNRKAATGAYGTISGKDLDEYPPAMFKEGGSGASVRYVDPSKNRGAGACMGNLCRGLSDGTIVKIIVVD